MENLKIGDLVKVINPGKGYSSYTSMANKFEMKGFVKDRMLFNENKDYIYKIIDIYIQQYKYSLPVHFTYIRNINNNKEFIIDITGLKLEPYEEFITKEEFSV